MGTYLNPGNSGFAEIIKSDYVDKTEMISLINNTIGTKRKLSCVSRPRRFGKSYAAQMLCAYYDRTCDSRGLFEQYRIAEDPGYERRLREMRRQLRHRLRRCTGKKARLFTITRKTAFEA